MIVMLEADAELAAAAGPDSFSGCAGTMVDWTDSAGRTIAIVETAVVLTLAAAATRRLVGAFSRAELRLVWGL